MYHLHPLFFTYVLALSTVLRSLCSTDRLSSVSCLFLSFIFYYD